MKEADAARHRPLTLKETLANGEPERDPRDDGTGADFWV
jgi:hypothetical protein